jgi:hypothetical protein
MRNSHLSPSFLALALLAACDVGPSPADSRIEVRFASMDDDSMSFVVAVDDEEREVHVADFDGVRAVAVIAQTTEGPLVTMVSETDPECVTEDAIACELTEAALDGTLDDLAAELDEMYSDVAAPLDDTEFKPATSS